MQCDGENWTSVNGCSRLYAARLVGGSQWQLYADNKTWSPLTLGSEPYLSAPQ